MRSIAFISVFFLTCLAHAQKTAPLWHDFLDARKSGRTPVLPDFSYAGYHWSEQEIPSVTKRKYFKVTDFGATPNDSSYDDEAIQKTIRAAEANPDGGVVFFPPGKYLIASDTDSRKGIRITRGNIVLKGSGSGAGGTEIYQAHMRINGRQFLFRPEHQNSVRLTTIAKNATRESFWVEVTDPSRLKVGQDVVITHRSEAFTRLYFDPLPLKPEWTRLFGEKGGMLIYEIHTIEQIEGKRVKFKNPLHFDLTLVPDIPFEIVAYSSIDECGIEDILFTSNWKTYPDRKSVV